MTEMNLEKQLANLLESGKCMGLYMLSNTCKASELEIIKALPQGMAYLYENKDFDNVWKFLCSIDSLTFFIETSGNIFEIKTKVGEGREGFGYFNLFGSDRLNGHLTKSSVSTIAFLKIPFMHLESRQIAFLNKDGKVMYSFYLPREQQQIEPKAEQAFNDFVNHKE